MKLIVGLGNPGLFYRSTRHNIGYNVVKALARAHKINFKKDKEILSFSGKGRFGIEDVVLAMPLTFMNLSGVAVSALRDKYAIGLDNLLVVCDDLDLELGRMKIKGAGSSGGHRGLESIIGSLGESQFARLRLGIGRPRPSVASSSYVLAPFSRKENKEVNRVREMAVECCRSWVSGGVTEAMNLFNKRSGLKHE